MDLDAITKIAAACLDCATRIHDICLDAQKNVSAKRKREPSPEKAPKKKRKFAPKRAKTAYFCFLDGHRDEAKANNPNMSFGEIARLLASQWKNLSDEDKKVFSDLASSDKERYERENSEWMDDPEKWEEEHKMQLKQAKLKSPRQSPAVKSVAPATVPPVKPTELLSSKVAVAGGGSDPSGPGGSDTEASGSDSSGSDDSDSGDSDSGDSGSDDSDSSEESNN
eukprot:14308_1